jgi:AbrB family looped-hinge helix DNA binding protein
MVHGMIGAMRTTIDKAGRVVIPKEIRRKAGLVPGSELEVRLENGTIELEPVPAPYELRREGEFLVIHHLTDVPPLTSEDVERIRQEIYLEREERILHPRG